MGVMDIVDVMAHEKQDEYIIFKMGGGVRKIMLIDILYCETQKNYQILHLVHEECRIRMTGGKMYEHLRGFRQFKKCGSSFIFNMDHITSVDKEKVYLDDGSKVYIPRTRVAEFKGWYFEYHMS